MSGFDGVAYKSSLNPEGHNVALFEPHNAVCTCCLMVQVKAVSYEWEESGNPIWISGD